MTFQTWLGLTLLVLASGQNRFWFGVGILVVLDSVGWLR